MPKVKVWNDNVHPHTETFKSQTISIPAGGYIEMDYFEAVEFKGKYTPIRHLGSGAADPTCYKMIRVEEPVEPVIKDDGNVFHATGKAFTDPAQVIAFAQAYAAANPTLIAPKNDDAEASRITMSRSEYEALLSRVNALESEKTPHKGPGRPRKEA